MKMVSCKGVCVLQCVAHSDIFIIPHKNYTGISDIAVLFLSHVEGPWHPY